MKGRGGQTHQHAGLDGDVLNLEEAHHAAYAVPAKYAEHVVVQTQEEPGAARVPLPAQ